MCTQVDAQVRLVLSTTEGLLALLPSDQVLRLRPAFVEKAEAWMDASKDRVSPKIREYHAKFVSILKGGDPMSIDHDPRWAPKEAKLTGDQVNEVFGDYQASMRETEREIDEVASGRTDPAEIDDKRIRGGFT